MLSRRSTQVVAFGICALATCFGLWLGEFRSRLMRPSPYTLIPATFSIWEREPLSRHLTLAFHRQEDFDQRRAYWHKSSPWLGLLYAGAKPLKELGVPYAVAQRGVVLLTFGGILLLAWATLDFAGPPRQGQWSVDEALTFGPALLALCTMLTLPSLWVASIIGNPEDQNRFLTSVAVAYISVLDFKSLTLDRIGWTVAIAVAVFAPTSSVFLILVLGLLGISGEGPHARSGLQWPRWRAQAIVLSLITVVGIVGPYLVGRFGGFQGLGSGVLFRSGLDGSTQYFVSMTQAVLQPVDAGRRWMLAPIPVAAASAAIVMFAFSRPLAERMLRQFLVCLTPALCWIVFFPQAVSIHPYLFDFGLIFPGAFCLAYWLTTCDVRDVLSGRRALILALVIVLSALLATNYIDLARLKGIAG